MSRMRTGPFLASDTTSRTDFWNSPMRLGQQLRLALILSLAAVGCGRSGSSSGSVDTALLRTAGGDVMLADGGRLPYEITSQRYTQWETARRGLRAAKLGVSMSIDPLRPTERDIQKAVEYFERNGRARRIIEDAGLTARDYVLTTLALEQQMAVASGRWGDREAPRAHRQEPRQSMGPSSGYCWSLSPQPSCGPPSRSSVPGWPRLRLVL